MDLLLLIARLLLAIVFAVAGVGKLLDREGSRQALIGFGVPERLAPPLAILLPLAELTVAVALLPVAFAFWGAAGAFGLLMLFIVGIATSMARGEAPDCHCFGQIHSEPAGWSTLIRNAALAGVAGFIVFTGGSEPGASLTGWRAELTTAEQIGLAAVLITAVILAAQGWFLIQLMAQNGRLLERVERLEAGAESSGQDPERPARPSLPERGLPVGSPAPAFSLSGLYGETMTLDALLAPAKPVLLLFTDPKCVPCNALLPEIARWQREYADRMTAAVISRRDVAANLPKAEEHGLRTVLLQEELEVYTAYQAQGTPSAVLVQADGTIGSPPAGGARQIQQLVDSVIEGSPIPTGSSERPAGAMSHNGMPRSAAGGPAHRRTPTAPLSVMPVGGQPVPEIVLPDLTGDTVDLADLGGHPTVLLFWNPNCGFCRRMIDDLKAWETDRPDDAPALLIVSSGGIDAQQAMELRTPFLLDEGYEAGRYFGVNGTPSAVLIDGKGRIASNVMVGADNVMGLLDPARRTAPSNGHGTHQPLGPLVRVGSPVPDFELPDLEGNLVDASTLHGSEVMVLFWDPSCGFCERMLPDLKQWETKRPEGAPELLVISTGAVETNRAMGLRATVLLDQGFDVGRRFGASGTPSAVLVDRKGRIASTVAAGAPSILDLLETTTGSRR